MPKRINILMTEGITRSAARKVVLGVVGLFCVLLFHGPLYAADSKVNDVIIVCKQHFDIGYTDFAHKVLDYYRGPMFDSALKAIDATREAPKELQFVWTVPGWPMKEIVGAKQQQARREKILDALRQGRVVIHALPGTTHTESLDLESYVRGLVFSSRLCRELELPLPRDAKMTDVP